MTIFRDELGAWFYILFVSLLIGKVWSWIGEGRVEILEQQPPANPRLFHARLATSLILSIIFDAYFLDYTVGTLREQARPNMIVMFAFEFAVLSVNSVSTCIRYCISLRELAVAHKQVQVRVQERREQLRRERQSRGQDGAEQTAPVEEEIDEEGIDVPGWEEKGRWVFYLDLATGASPFRVCIIRLTNFRLHQACPLLDVLLRSMCLLRHADSHHPRRCNHHSILLQADCGLRQVSASHTGHACKIPRCNSTGDRPR